MTVTIGIVTIGQEPGFFAGRYFREILTTASLQLAAHAHLVRIVPLTHEQATSADSLRAILAEHQVAAALVLAPGEALVSSLPVVFHDFPSIIISSPNLDVAFSYVNSDNYVAMRDIVNHLVERGSSRIRLLLPPLPVTGDYRERRRSYEATVAAAGLEPLIAYLPHPITDDVVDREVLGGNPDALITPSDNDALAILSRLQRRGIRVPQDIRLVGFDDEDFAAETFPSLTTVSQPLGEMARRATGYLLDRLAGVDRGIYHAILPNRLVVRESSG